MKPEHFGKKGPELTEIEQSVFQLLSKEGSMLLEDLKNQVNLSNKQWDKTIKGLRKHEVINVVKRGDEVYIQAIE